MSSVATRLESRKSLLGTDTGYGYGGHSYNQSYGDGDFSPTYDQPPVHQPAYPDNSHTVDPAYNQGYAYREGLTPSAPAPSTHHGSMGFLTSRWPAAFMAISLLQAVLCICFEAYVDHASFAKHCR